MEPPHPSPEPDSSPRPPRVEQAPAVITLERVRSALEHLATFTPRHPSPLEHLALVDAFLDQPEMVTRDRGYALRTLLAMKVRQQAHQQAQISGLALPDQPTQADAERLLKCTPPAGRQLIGWLWLYLRYGCDMVDLSASQFAAWAGITDKSRQRYARTALKQLTDRLIDDERAAIRAARERRLLAALPVIPPLTLYGRERLLDQTLTALQPTSPRHLQVTGRPGIGKTSFVQQMMRRLILAQQLTDLHWPPGPPKRVIDLRDRLVDSYRQHASGRSLRETVSARALALVIDDAEALYADQAELLSLLYELSSALVILISREAPVLAEVPLRVRLTPLRPPDAEALARAEFARHLRGAGWQPGPGELHAVLSRAGGVPARIRHEVATYWRTLDDH